MSNREYISTTPNTCKLKLHIPLGVINNVFKDLSENYEISGVINFNGQDKVTNASKNKGSSDSVFTPNNVINFHTHPISAYRNASTTWGWPSGEDIRETIKFVLGGNKAHLVFTVEGLYTIQVNPCKIKKMKEKLTDVERGTLIFLIEEYFKSTHNFRGVDEVNQMDSVGNTISPYSYVHFVNTFDLGNLITQKTVEHSKLPRESILKVGHTGIHHMGEDVDNAARYCANKSETFSKLPNNGFPEIEENTVTTTPIKKYISPEDCEEIDSIGTNGKEVSMFKKKVADLDKTLKTILRKFDSSPCTSTWNNKSGSWFFINFFPSNQYPRMTKELTRPANGMEIKLLHEPFIRIFSDKKEGCTIEHIAHTNKFSMGNINKISKFGSNKSTKNINSFGTSEFSPQQRYVFIKYITSGEQPNVTVLNRIMVDYQLPEISQDTFNEKLRWFNEHL